jgi:hypothetical protein
VQSKHQGKHTRPYACKHSSCNYRRFGDKAGLTRHLREVHGTEVHYCLFVLCNRNSRGFPRKYNLIQHQKRCHSDQSTHLQRETSPSSSLDLLQGGDDIAKPGLPPIRETDRLSGTEIDCTRGESSSQVEDRVMKRLRELKILRAEIDRDIAMLEGTLGLIGENSS